MADYSAVRPPFLNGILLTPDSGSGDSLRTGARGGGVGSVGGVGDVVGVGGGRGGGQQ